MSALKLCRLCANFADDTNSEKLFEWNQRNLLRQVKDLTGLQLKNAADLPQFICEPCQEQTLQAHQFRELCIRVQQHFASEEFVIQIEEAYQTDGVSLNFEICENALQQQKREDKHANLQKHTEENAEDVESELSMDTDEEAMLAEFMKAREIRHAKTKASKKKQVINENDTSTRRQELTCRLCDICLPTKKILAEHMLRHLNDRQFACDHCPKKFFTTSEMKRHVNTHSEKRRYSGQYGESHFKNRHDLVHHEREHATTVLRPFACNQCGKAFKLAGTLKHHMATHFGAREFECEMCNVSFKLRKTLVQHYRSKLHKETERK